ncbi:methionine aminopeptidase [Janibacter sp. GXQ6167]|uniref:methionine aminopeptidase n=1 Tax=Janibacter sp. GXQ6167 TaxID=3240791 RepID=UPI003526BE1D
MDEGVGVVFWYNITTGQVESDEEKSPGADLMGPYASRDEASRALQTAAEKTEKWDEEDRAWDGYDDE